MKANKCETREPGELKQLNYSKDCRIKIAEWNLNNLYRCLPPSTMTLLFLLKKVSLIRRSENYTKKASSPFVLRKYKIFTCELQF